MRDEKGRFLEGSYKDYTGIERGRFTFISFDHIHVTPTGKKIPYWLCECRCGTRKILSSKDVMSGHTLSCGCLQKEKASKAQFKHGMSESRLYQIWENMRKRCNNPASKRYSTYGKRGIRVCKEWNDDFSAFKDWAFLNGYSEDLTIDRIDVNGNYEPTNCQWLSMNEQAKNKTNTHHFEINGKTYLTSELSALYDIPEKTIYARYYRGDRGERLVRPLGQRKTTPR